MKIIRTIPIIAPGLLALALLAAPASARAEEPAKEKPLTKNQQKYDADKDGKLNDEEKAAAKAAAAAKSKQTREENLAKYDANHDGKLDDDERAKKTADEQAASGTSRKASPTTAGRTRTTGSLDLTAPRNRLRSAPCAPCRTARNRRKPWRQPRWALWRSARSGSR